MVPNFYTEFLWPREPILVEVDAKVYYFEGVIQPFFSGLAKK
jgi:hypothetical protein